MSVQRKGYNSPEKWWSVFIEMASFIYLFFSSLPIVFELSAQKTDFSMAFIFWSSQASSDFAFHVKEFATMWVGSGK